MKIYEKIKMARHLRQLSRSEMAEKMGMSVDGYALLERGERRFDDEKIEKVAQILEMSLSELMSIDEQSTMCLLSENHTENAERGFLLIGSHFSHIYYDGAAVLAAENGELKLTVQHQAELLAQKDREIETLRELVRLTSISAE